MCCRHSPRVGGARPPRAVSTHLVCVQLPRGRQAYVWSALLLWISRSRPQVPNPSSAAMTDHDPAPPTVGAPEGPVPVTPPVPPPFSEQQLAWLQGHFAPPGTPTHPPPAGAGERIARAGVFYWHADPNVACVLVTSPGSGGTPSPRDVPPQRAGCAQTGGVRSGDGNPNDYHGPLLAPGVARYWPGRWPAIGPVKWPAIGPHSPINAPLAYHPPPSPRHTPSSAPAGPWPPHRPGHTSPRSRHWSPRAPQCQWYPL